jgi:CcmD family protein
MLLSYLLQEGPANTTNYMIAGFAVIFGVMLIYLISLIVRQRNLQKDLDILEEIQVKE